MTTVVAERVRVVGRDAAGPYTILSFESAPIAREVKPGQFVSLAQHAPGRLLRRPFSVYGVDGDTVRVAFDVVGEGTAWLDARRPGDTIEVAGPLGNAFTPPAPGSRALLVGGGYGAAPLLFFAQTLRASGVATHLVLGAATAARLFEPGRAATLAGATTVTTDDGSAGVRGLATDAMAGVACDAVYACGPMPMLAAVTRAAPADVPVEVAVEEFMACGIGVCWTCVVPTHEDGYRRHVRSCVDGPVFDGRAIAWA